MQISVIIPTYNRANFIVKAIESVLNQTVKVDEIIVIDDGSSDKTQELLKNYNIKYKYQENSGVSKARNQGIKLSKNEWITFLDSDDIWEETKIQHQIDFHKNNKDILFSHTDELWKFNGKIIKQNKHQQKPYGECFNDNISLCKIGASTIFIHRSIFDNIGLFDEELVACEDYDLWLRILTKYKLGLVNKKLIEKIAGHKGQLSFETPLMDKYRITALLKHKKQTLVKQEIIKKCNILIKGAVKHNNYDIEKYYTDLKSSLQTF